MNTLLPETPSIPVIIAGTRLEGHSPVVLIGPNGVGKSRVARAISKHDGARYIPAQRRTFLSDQIQVMPKDQADGHFTNQVNQAMTTYWEQSSDIDMLFSRMLSEDHSRLSENERARRRGENPPLVDDSTLAKLTGFWERVFPGRELIFEGFAPAIRRVDGPQIISYPARSMSDGERGSVYLAARVIRAPSGFLVIDEPELHLHRRLAIDYWDELEAMRPDIRFVYATHDLPFAISRANATIAVVRSSTEVEFLRPSDLPPTIDDDMLSSILGAATLSVSARRFVFYEGNGLVHEPARGLAARFFRAWFDTRTTVAIGLGNRAAVVEAVRAFTHSQVVANGTFLGIIDRDHYPGAQLEREASQSMYVLKVHEFESLLALPGVVRAIASHLGKPQDVWPLVREALVGRLVERAGRLAALRARARIEGLVGSAMSREHLSGSATDVRSAHVLAFSALAPADAFGRAFDEELAALGAAESHSDESLLRLVEGKETIELAAKACGASYQQYVELILSALGPAKPAPLQHLATQLESVLVGHLPARALSQEPQASSE